MNDEDGQMGAATLRLYYRCRRGHHELVSQPMPVRLVQSQITPKHLT